MRALRRFDTFTAGWLSAGKTASAYARRYGETQAERNAGSGQSRSTSLRAMERSAPSLGIHTGDARGKLAQLIWLLAVALIVCTISNITNMLLSVTKRFREIGTMKCLGAFDGSILILFLVEAMILGGAALTVAVVAVLSFVGAAYPAWVASRMLPVEAMRSV